MRENIAASLAALQPGRRAAAIEVRTMGRRVRSFLANDLFLLGAVW